MVKRPTEPFWNASHHTPAQKSQLQDPHKLNPARDKDNTGRAPKPPTFVPGGGASNLAPRGALGTKPGLPAAPIVPAKPMHVEIINGTSEKDFGIQGTITSMEGYRFTAKVNDLPSQFGVDGGKITKLQINHGDRIAAQFDRGWDVKPQTAQDREALQKIRTVFDPPDREFTPVAPKSPDKDHGHDR